MKSEIIHYGMWQIPVKAINVYCPDGIYRTCRITGEADTFFTLPAQCQVRGKTVTGFISNRYDAPEGEMYFWGFGRNMAAFFPDFDKAYDFISNEIATDSRIDDYELRDIFKGKWIITFKRNQKDWTGQDYEIHGHKYPDNTSHGR